MVLVDAFSIGVFLLAASVAFKLVLNPVPDKFRLSFAWATFLFLLAGLNISMVITRHA